MYSFVQLLEKATNSDSDIRYMALNDLILELSRETSLGHAEVKIIQMVLQLLGDKDGEVQNLAVKCLVPLSKKITTANLEGLIEQLQGWLLKEETRDISTLCLKTLFSELSNLTLISHSLPRLLGLVSHNPIDIIDIILSILQKYNSVLSDDQALQRTFVDTLKPLVFHKRPAIRKRASLALATCSGYLEKGFYQELLESLYGELIKSKSDYEKACSLLSTLSAFSFNPLTEQLRDLAIELVAVDDDSLKEQCLLSLAAFPIVNSEHLLNLALEYLLYDPNYNDDDEMEEEEEEEEEDYSDYDDISWRVRRAACKLIATIVPCYDLTRFYDVALPVLVKRLKEREETVLLEILATITILVKNTDKGAKPLKRRRPNYSSDMNIDCPLRDHVDAIIKGLLKHLKSSSITVKTACFGLLTDIVSVLFGLDLSLLIPHIESSLASTDTTLKLTVLKFLGSLGNCSEVEGIDKIAICLSTTADDKFYKISAEALYDLSILVKFASTSTLSHIYATAKTKLESPETDIEVKENALLVIGALLELDLSRDIHTEIEQLLLSKLSNEMLRLSTIKILTSTSYKGITLSQSVLALIQSFLSKSSKPLVHASLACLTSLLNTSDQELLDTTIELTKDSDSQTISLALGLLAKIVQVSPQLIPVAAEKMQILIQKLIESPHLFQEEPLLKCMQSFTHQSNVYQLLCSSTNKDSFYIISKCLGLFPFNITELIQKCEANDPLSLLVLGEVGSLQPLNVDPNELVRICSNSEQGLVTLGKLGKGQPLLAASILGLCKENEKYFTSLKQLLTKTHENDKEIWDLLLSKAASTQSDSQRNVLSECLGLLVKSNPSVYLTLLSEQLGNSQPNIRSVVLLAVRYTFTDDAYSLYDELLSPLILEFLKRVQDSDLSVRKSALSAFNSAAHSKPYLLRPCLPTLLPLLYQETYMKEELIHVVEMGPFKHKVDSGLDCRKTAFECLFTLIQTCESFVDPVFLGRVVSGLSDPSHEIKILSHIMIQKLAKKSFNIKDVSDSLKVAINTKPKSNAVKQEVEKIKELVRITAKTIIILNKYHPIGDLYNSIQQPDSPCYEFIPSLLTELE